MVHENSLKAYIEEKDERIINRQKQILDYIKKNNSVTAREIMIGLCYDDMNQIRPRITELKQQKLIHEAGKIVCSVSRKKVATFTLTKKT